MIFSLNAHIALDEMLACHQRLRELLTAAQRGEYTRAAFNRSYMEIMSDLDLADMEISFVAVADQLKD